MAIGIGDQVLNGDSMSICVCEGRQWLTAPVWPCRTPRTLMATELWLGFEHLEILETPLIFCVDGGTRLPESVFVQRWIKSILEESRLARLTCSAAQGFQGNHHRDLRPRRSPSFICSIPHSDLQPGDSFAC